MKPDQELQRILAKIKPRTETTTTFRCVAWKYQASMLSAIGSYKTGGRFNPPSTFEALYLADTPNTAMLEVGMLVQTNERLIGVPTRPMGVLSIDCRLERVLDLTDPNMQEALGTNPQELSGNWLVMQRSRQTPPTQRLGRAIHALESIEAFWVPSARAMGARNLVVLPTRLQAGSSRVRVYDPDGIFEAVLP
jgi:RES domain-containing protein